MKTIKLNSAMSVISLVLISLLTIDPKGWLVLGLVNVLGMASVPVLHKANFGKYFNVNMTSEFLISSFTHVWGYVHLVAVVIGICNFGTQIGLLNLFEFSYNSTLLTAMACTSMLITIFVFQGILPQHLRK